MIAIFEYRASIASGPPPVAVVLVDLATGETAEVDGPLTRTGGVSSRAGDVVIRRYGGTEPAIAFVDLTADLATAYVHMPWPVETEPNGSAHIAYWDRAVNRIWWSNGASRNLVSVDLTVWPPVGTDHGDADPTHPAGEPYMESVAFVSEAHVMVAIGRADYRCVVYDVQAGTWGEPKFADEGDVDGLCRSTGDALYYRRTLADGSHLYYEYDPATDALSEITEGEWDGLTFVNQRDFDAFYGQDSDVGAWVGDADLAEVDSSGLAPGPDGACSFRWRLASDPGTWMEATWTVPLAELDLTVVAAGAARPGKALAVGFGYGPWLDVEPGVSEANHGPVGVSAYSTCVAEDGRVYVGGYASRLLEWDPSELWDYNSEEDDTDGNPWIYARNDDGTRLSKYVRHLATAGPYVLAGGQWLRDEYGAEAHLLTQGAGLGDASIVSLYKDTSPLSSGSTPSIRSVAVCYDGSAYRGLVSRKRADETEPARIDVYACATGALERTVTLDEARTGGWTLWALPGGDALALSGTRLVRFDPADGSQAYAVTLTNALTGQTLGAVSGGCYRAEDGMVYAWSGVRLYRIDPADGSATPLGITSDVQPQLYSDGDDLFFVDGPQLRRILGSKLPEA